MLKKLSVLSVLAVVLVFSCLPMAAFAAAYTDVSVTEAKQMIDADPSLVILDVRTQSYYDQGHIRNARLIPNTELASRLSELNPNDRILVYCNVGVTSQQASETLVNNGFLHVYNMEGGITAWTGAGYPVYVRYASIQQAINNADLGDTLYISSGIYYEHVMVNKSVSLVGENKDTTIVDGSSDGTVLNVTASNLLISDFTLQRTGCGEFRCGIYVADSGHYVNITNNHIVFCCGGIALNKTQSVLVAYNNISNNANWGINLLDSSYVSIFKNVINGNPHGIDFENSNNNQIDDNHISNAIEGIDMLKSNNNIVYGNTVTSITFYGIYLQNSNNTLFSHNNFAENKRHVASLNSVNVWDDGFEGNYWSNYTGVDVAPKDGIGDTSHSIDQRNDDTRPLMGRYNRYTAAPSLDVIVICNSTVTEFSATSIGAIRIVAANSTGDQAYGFCRVIIPHALTNVTNIEVIIDEGLVAVLDSNYNVHDNGTHRWIYFAYQHSTREIIIIPEFPATLILPLLTVFSLVAVILARKKKQTQKRTRNIQTI